jgi:hypothetical protein
MEYNKELTGLLYRKIVSENSMDKYSKGIKVHSDLSNELERKLSIENIDPLEKARLEIEKNKNDWETRVFVTNYKSTRREYQHNLIPQIQKLATEEEQKSISFLNHYEEAEKLAKIEIFGKTEKQPANIEHISIIEDIKKYISILNELIAELKGKIETELDSYSLAKMKKELFDSEIQVQTMQKRLNNRLDYYTNQFLPIYTVELAEAKEKIELYYERAVLIVAKGLDVQLKFVVDIYEDHKNSEERLWLYYTALKNRVNSIIDEIKKNPKQFKDCKELTKPI